MNILTRLSSLFLWVVTLFLIFTLKIEAKNLKEKKCNAIISVKVNRNSKTLSAGLSNFTLNDFKYLQRENVEENYPAYELYEESWNTKFLKAYTNIVVPDSFVVDVSNFVMPIKGIVTSPYGFRGNRFHYGTDIRLQVGDTVFAAFDGKVRIKKYDYEGYGYYLVLRHPNGLETVYGHLSQFLVEQEQNVKAGQPIGLGGNTGRSSGSHLHFEFRFLGNAINPAEIINFGELSLKDDIFIYIKDKSGKNYRFDESNLYRNTSKRNHASTSYRILRGDTLNAIAKKHATTVNKLCKINKIRSTARLHIGNSIRIS